MAEAAVGNRLSESLSFRSFDLLITRGNEESILKKFFSFLEYLLGRKKHSWAKLYQNYVGSFLAFINSRIPFQVSLQDLSLVHMSLRNHNSRDDPSPKSFRELMEDSPSKDRPAEDGLDAVIRYHGDKQSEISANMIQMARALKTQSLAANSIIKRDVKNLEKAKSSAEQNASALKDASSKLATCSKDGMNWCLVILVIVVLMIFINMVLFMKIMKKN